MYYDETTNFFDYTNKEKNEFEIDIDNLNIFNFRKKSENEIMNYVEGFNKGNMFLNLYDPYKSHEYKVSVNGRRDQLLLNIQMLDFALNDLNLYLDLNPNDKNILNLFNDYSLKFTEYKKTFEKEYGPLTAVGSIYENDFTWVKNPWPWDRGGSV